MFLYENGSEICHYGLKLSIRFTFWSIKLKIRYLRGGGGGGVFIYVFSLRSVLFSNVKEREEKLLKNYHSIER